MFTLHNFVLVPIILNILRIIDTPITHSSVTDGYNIIAVSVVTGHGAISAANTVVFDTGVRARVSAAVVAGLVKEQLLRVVVVVMGGMRRI